VLFKRLKPLTQIWQVTLFEHVTQLEGHAAHVPTCKRKKPDSQVLQVVEFRQSEQLSVQYNLQVPFEFSINPVLHWSHLVKLLQAEQLSIHLEQVLLSVLRKYVVLHWVQVLLSVQFMQFSEQREAGAGAGPWVTFSDVHDEFAVSENPFAHVKQSELLQFTQFAEQAMHWLSWEKKPALHESQIPGVEQFEQFEGHGGSEHWFVVLA